MPTSQYKQLQYTWTLNGARDHSFLHSPATKPSHTCSESSDCTGTSKFCGDSLTQGQDGGYGCYCHTKCNSAGTDPGYLRYPNCCTISAYPNGKGPFVNCTQDNECGDGLTCIDLTPTQLKTYRGVKKWCCSTSGSTKIDRCTET